jgi:hypothetical protein
LGIECEINCAYVFRVLCVGKDLLPGLATVERTVDAALGVRFVDVAESGDVDAVGVGGIDGDLADLTGFGEADVMPGLAGVSGFEDTDAVGVLAADVGLAGADVDDVRIRGCDGDRSDRADGDAGERIVGDGEPGAACVFGLPETTADRAHVEGVGLCDVARDRIGSTSAHGTDVTPMKAREHLCGILLGCERKSEGKRKRRDDETACGGHAGTPMD